MYNKNYVEEINKKIKFLMKKSKCFIFILSDSFYGLHKGYSFIAWFYMKSEWLCCKNPEFHDKNAKAFVIGY